MFNQAQQNAGQVAGNVQQVLLSLRSAAHDALFVCQWVATQTPADLEAIGFSAGDVSMMQSVCGDMVTLLAMMNGGPAAVQKDYISEALPLMGPNR